MRLVLRLIKRKYPEYYNSSTIKSLSNRVNRTSKQEALNIRIKKFIQVLVLPFLIIKNLKKTQSSIVIIDNFLPKKQQDLRINYIEHFKPEYQGSGFIYIELSSDESGYS